VGYDTHTKTYYLFNTRTKKLIFRHDVRFNKTCIELDVKQGASSLEYNTTTKEISPCVFSLKQNTTRKELGNLKWPCEIKVFQNVSQSLMRDDIDMKFRVLVFLIHHFT
jgi:hypothetical protein